MKQPVQNPDYLCHCCNSCNLWTWKWPTFSVPLSSEKSPFLKCTHKMNLNGDGKKKFIFQNPTRNEGNAPIDTSKKIQALPNHSMSPSQQERREWPSIYCLQVGLGCLLSRLAKLLQTSSQILKMQEFFNEPLLFILLCTNVKRMRMAAEEVQISWFEVCVSSPQTWTYKIQDFSLNLEKLAAHYEGSTRQEWVCPFIEVLH